MSLQEPRSELEADSSDGKNEQDGFEEDKCELVKYVILQKELEDGDVEFTSIELHTSVGVPSAVLSQGPRKSPTTRPKFRVYTHHGTVSGTKDENSGTKSSRFAQAAPAALKMYNEEYKAWTSKGMTRTKKMLSRWLGSNILTKRLLESQTASGEVSEAVAMLADNLWKEAMGELSRILTVPIKNIPPGKVEKAEAVLLQIKRALLSPDSEDAASIEALSKQFHELIPHRNDDTHQLDSMRKVAVKQDLCQLILDVINVNEALGWKKRPTAESKYRAMRCFIEHLDQDHPEYRQVEELVLSTAPRHQDLTILNIFAVSRALDEFKFDRSIGNERLLFHSSKARNFLGILSRGILLPKIVVEMFGIERWDAGMLGSGIYFGDSTSTSAKYSTAGEFTGTRFMAVSNVALGRIKDVYEKRLDLESAPIGFDSVHGVRKSKEIESFFKEDEYTVYQANQHCLRFLVEFKLTERNEDGHDGSVSSPSALMSSDDDSDDTTDSDSDDDFEIDTTDIQGILYPEARIKAGLTGGDGAGIELKDVHVRAKIIDLAAEVTVLQKYENIGRDSAETRYVFPLDECAAVCGFEAYINGKHVVGVVKEKEEAKTSYQKAVREGHGAYLMEEEASNIFSITVGNLPPGSSVIVRITYVTELVVEGDRIAFNLLGSVAPWKRNEILAAKYDEKGQSVTAVRQNDRDRNESFVASIEMPGKIRRVDCPTHTVKFQRKNDRHVSVAMSDGDRLIDGIQLLIDMEDAHKPRLWRERHPDDMLLFSTQQAYMVVFYPEFQVSAIKSPEVVIMLDRSTSMKGEPMKDAKKLVHMILENLPPGSRYNLIVFGNDFEELYPASVVASDTNIRNTETYLKSVSWERGATEVWRPLRAMALLASDDARLIRNGFLISDGHVSNEQDTLIEVATNRHINRLFTFGVSSDSNRHVLRTLADTGGGAYEQFDPRSKSTWEAKVKAQVRRSCQPAATSIRVDWRAKGPESHVTLTRKQVIQAPSQIASLFTGTRLVLYALGPDIAEVVLSADIEGREVTCKVTSENCATNAGLTLHRLATRGVVRDWEVGSVHADRLENDAMMDDVRRMLVQLGIEFNIISPLTSFVAIEERSEDDTKKDDPSMSSLLAEMSPGGRDTQHGTWHSQPASTGTESSDAITRLEDILSRAQGAQNTFSFVTAENQYQRAMELASESLPPTHPCVQEAFLAVANFYLHIKGEATKAKDVLDDILQRVKTSTSAEIDRRLPNMSKICQCVIDEGFQGRERQLKPPSESQKHDRMVRIESRETQQPCDAPIPSAKAMDATQTLKTEELVSPTLRDVDMDQLADQLELLSPTEDTQKSFLAHAEEACALKESPVDVMELSEEVYSADEPEPAYMVESIQEIQLVEDVMSPVLCLAEPASRSLAFSYETEAAYLEPVEELQICEEVQEVLSPVLESSVDSLPLMLAEVESVTELRKEVAEPMRLEQRMEKRLELAEPVLMAKKLELTEPVMLQERMETRAKMAEPVMMAKKLELAEPVMLEEKLAFAEPVMLEKHVEEKLELAEPVMLQERIETPLKMAEPVMMAKKLKLAEPVMLEARMETRVKMAEPVMMVQHMEEKMALAEPVMMEQHIEESLELAEPVMMEEKLALAEPVMLQERMETRVKMAEPVMMVQHMEEKLALAEPVMMEQHIEESLELAEPVMMEEKLALAEPVMLQERMETRVKMAEPVLMAKKLELAEPAMLEERMETRLKMAEPVMMVQRMDEKTALAQPVMMEEKLELAEPVMMKAHIEERLELVEAPELDQVLDATPALEADDILPKQQKLAPAKEDLEKTEAFDIITRILQVGHQDEQSRWCWEVADIEGEFGIDCSKVTDALQQPDQYLDMDDTLLETWMSSLGLIKRIVATLLVTGLLSCLESTLHSTDIDVDKVRLSWEKTYQPPSELCTLAVKCGLDVTWKDALTVFQLENALDDIINIVSS
ncbi:protein mono-ADP-ribosyltransferase PARP4-like [Diadema antillarum]|uniref:protein mono-ADP-ribosyltransferase PARP4-like n=1 Tax=Diadema antillarum TaxID=105358 RepID=UPI003A855E3A